MPPAAVAAWKEGMVRLFTRLPPLWRFAFTAFLGVILITLAWLQVARWVAYPAALMAKAGLEQAAPQWVRVVHAEPGQAVVLDSSVAIATAQTGWRQAEITLDMSRAATPTACPSSWR